MFFDKIQFIAEATAELLKKVCLPVTRDACLPGTIAESANRDRTRKARSRVGICGPSWCLTRDNSMASNQSSLSTLIFFNITLFSARRCLCMLIAHFFTTFTLLLTLPQASLGQEGTLTTLHHQISP